LARRVNESTWISGGTYLCGGVAEMLLIREARIASMRGARASLLCVGHGRSCARC